MVLMLLGWYLQDLTQDLRFFLCFVHIKSLESVYSAVICARKRDLVLEHLQNSNRTNIVYVEFNLEQRISMGFFHENDCE